MKKVLLFSLVILTIWGMLLSGCAVQPAMQPPAPAPAQSPSASQAKPGTTSAAPTGTPVAPAPAAQGKAIELRYAHQNPPTSRTALEHINVWVKKAEEATKGKLKITLYPAESLCKANETLEATRSGLTDITWIIGGYFPGRFPLTEAMALPFLGLSEGQIGGKTLSGGAINSHIFQEFYETLPEIQKEWSEFKVLYLYSSDPYFLVTNKRPVRNMNDLKGMKIRELGGPPSEMWKKLGASPLLINMPDVYDALQKGVIDGSGISWAQIVSYKIHEVIKYYTDAAMTLSYFAIIMNKESWNSLPKDVQDGLMSVSGMVGAEFGGEAQFGSVVKQDTLNAAKKGGFTLERVQPDEGEYAKWIRIAGKPVWEAWVAEKKARGLEGQKPLDTILKLMEKYKK